MQILDDAILHRVADDEARDEEKENVILDMSQRMNDNVDFDSSAIVGEDMFVKGMNVIRILKGASEDKSSCFACSFASSCTRGTKKVPSEKLNVDN